MARRKENVQFNPDVDSEVENNSSSGSEKDFDKAFDTFLKKDHSTSIIDNMKPLNYLSTKIPSLDYLLSGKPKSGGLPLSGKSIVFYGPEGGAKSSVVAHIIKQALDENFLVLFLNSEQGLTPERMEEFGIDLKSKNLRHIDPTDIEEAFEIIEKTVDLLIVNNITNKGVLVAWDSIAANTSSESLDRKMRDLEVATDAKVLKRGFHRIRKKIRQLDRCGLVFVQQSRMKIGAFGHADKYDLPGGQVLKHYCDGLVRFSRGKIFSDNNGQEVRISTPNKYRLTTPRQQIVLNFDYTNLFTIEESARSLVELLKETGYLLSAKGGHYFKDEPDKKFSKDSLKDDLIKDIEENNSELFNNLLEKCENYVLANKGKIRVTSGETIIDPEGVDKLDKIKDDDEEPSSTYESAEEESV